jgi:hypothetical protein
MRYTYLLILAFSLLTHNLQAQIRLIATRYDQSAQRHEVFRWNATNGTVLDSIRTNQQYIIASGSTFDSYTGIYYFRTPDGLNKAEFSPGVHTLIGPADLGNNAEIDMSNGRIHGVTADVIRDSNFVISEIITRFTRYDLATNTDSAVGIVPNISAIYGDGSAYNSNSGIYYFFAIDSVLGTCVYSVPTRDSVFSFTRASVNVPDLRVLEMVYDNEYNILYALAFNDSTSPSYMQLYRLNAATGALTLDASWPNLGLYQLTSLTMDQATSTLVFSAGVGGPASTLELQMYNTVQDTLMIGTRPSGSPLLVNEIEADNRQFAINRYGLATAVQPAIQNRLVLYPNPAQDQIRISGADLAALRVYDVSGRLVSERIGVGLDQIDVSGWVAGIYFLRAQGQDGSAYSGKFLKE